MPKKLFCFIGKPGAGKTTLLHALGVKSVDVLQFISKYKDKNGAITEGNKQRAWEELFTELSATKDPIIYAEFGTNKPSFVIENLEKLNRSTLIFLCLLDNETCLKRHQQRARKIATEQLQEKLSRNFPEEHLRWIRHHSIPFVFLNMKKPVEENAVYVNQIINQR